MEVWPLEVDKMDMVVVLGWPGCVLCCWPLGPPISPPSRMAGARAPLRRASSSMAWPAVLGQARVQWGRESSACSHSISPQMLVSGTFSFTNFSCQLQFVVDFKFGAGAHPPAHLPSHSAMVLRLRVGVCLKRQGGAGEGRAGCPDGQGDCPDGHGCLRGEHAAPLHCSLPSGNRGCLSGWSPSLSYPGPTPFLPR